MTITKVTRTLAVGAAALGLATLAPGPAMAADVKIQFEVSDVVTANVVTRCELSVPDGGNGLVILQSAKAQLCISSYSTYLRPGQGEYVKCLDTRCEQRSPAKAWVLGENDELSYSYLNGGLASLRADSGDRFHFSLQLQSPIVIGI